MRTSATIAWLLTLLATVPAFGQGFAQQAEELLSRLENVRLDEPFSFRVTDLRLRRDAIRLTLSHGSLVFLEEVQGRITGAIFEGRGEALVVPPSTLERKQLARFTGSPILTASFRSAYFRFTDNTFTEWMRQIRAGQGRPHHDADLVQRWRRDLPDFNRAHSPRLLMDFLESDPPTYFFARVLSDRLGWFDLTVDGRRDEAVLVGQAAKLEEKVYYNIWTSFASDEQQPPRPSARGQHYDIQTIIHSDLSLEGSCRITLEVLQPGARLLRFQLSRFLNVEEVTQNGRPVEFFQNAGLRGDEVISQGNDQVLVVLVEPLRTDLETVLEFHYRGEVISDLGNGVLFVGARGQWYPSLEDNVPARFDTFFRYPVSLKLVATGRRTAFREDNTWRESSWTAEVPVALAGFNIGDYESRRLQAGSYTIDVFANRMLEPHLLEKYRAGAPEEQPREKGRDDDAGHPQTPSLTPTALLDQVATDVADALEFFSRIFQPFPYEQLNVSQIPGHTGQGYPGLVYLPTYTFLRESDQVRLGLDSATARLFSQLMPAHEAAHQWWGTWVSAASYHERWLMEGLATYSGMLYFEQQRRNETFNRTWLRHFRDDLLALEPGGEPLDEAGALALGPRLHTSLNPNADNRIVYTKGPWVIHMLREVLRDPKTGSDQIFLDGLRELTTRPLGQPLSTEQFQRVFEKRLPAYADAEENGRLDWFFIQWVFDTGIPDYKLEWEVQPVEATGSGDANRFAVRGRIQQSEVPALFTMPVPLYARYQDRLEFLGRVIVTGTYTSFSFPVDRQPDDIVLDPNQTILRRPMAGE